MIFQTAEFFVGSLGHTADTLGGRRRQPSTVQFTSGPFTNQLPRTLDIDRAETRRDRTREESPVSLLDSIDTATRPETMNGTHIYLFLSRAWCCYKGYYVSTDGHKGEDADLQKSTVVRPRSASLGILEAGIHANAAHQCLWEKSSSSFGRVSLSRITAFPGPVDEERLTAEQRETNDAECQRLLSCTHF